MPYLIASLHRANWISDGRDSNKEQRPMSLKLGHRASLRRQDGNTKPKPDVLRIKSRNEAFLITDLVKASASDKLEAVAQP